MRSVNDSNNFERPPGGIINDEIGPLGPEEHRLFGEILSLVPDTGVPGNHPAGIEN